MLTTGSVAQPWDLGCYKKHRAVLLSLQEGFSFCGWDVVMTGAEEQKRQDILEGKTVEIATLWSCCLLLCFESQSKHCPRRGMAVGRNLPWTQGWWEKSNEDVVAPCVYGLGFMLQGDLCPTCPLCCSCCPKHWACNGIGFLQFIFCLVPRRNRWWRSDGDG